jgi:hypothetical protein
MGSRGVLDSADAGLDIAGTRLDCDLGRLDRDGANGARLDSRKKILETRIYLCVLTLAPVPILMKEILPISS